MECDFLRIVGNSILSPGNGEPVGDNSLEIFLVDLPEPVTRSKSQEIFRKWTAILDKILTSTDAGPSELSCEAPTSEVRDCGVFLRMLSALR